MPKTVSPFSSESALSGLTAVAVPVRSVVPERLVVALTALSSKRASKLTILGRSEVINGVSVPDGERNHRSSLFAAADVTFTSTVTLLNRWLNRMS